MSVTATVVREAHEHRVYLTVLGADPRPKPGSAGLAYRPTRVRLTYSRHGQDWRWTALLRGYRCLKSGADGATIIGELLHPYSDGRPPWLDALIEQYRPATPAAGDAP